MADACQAEFRIFYRTEQNILVKKIVKSEIYNPPNIQCRLPILSGRSVTNILSQHKVKVQGEEGQHLIEWIFVQIKMKH